MQRTMHTVTDFITLSCPACGASLAVTQDLDRCACSYCGKEHIVRRSGSTVLLAPVVERLDRIETGANRTAAELAIPRLRSEIAQLTGEGERVFALPVPKANKMYNLLGWAALLLLVVGSCGLSAGDVGLVQIGFISGFLLLAWFSYGANRKGRQFRTWQQSELARVEGEIVRRQKNLQTNEQAVQ